MSNTVIALKSSGQSGNTPSALSLEHGELALNYADGIIYYRSDSDTLGSIYTTQPAGVDGSIQFNDGGVFGYGTLTFDKANSKLSTTIVDATDVVVSNAVFFPNSGTIDSTGITLGSNVFWHSGNDGASSGLDADLLDGQQGAYYTANAGAALITAKAYTDTETTNRQANVGAAVIAVTSAYQANVGAGLIANKLESEANVGAGLISAISTTSSKYDKTGGTITGFVDITANLSVGTYIDLANDQANPTKVEGRIFYDSEQHALGYYNESDMTFQIGQEHVVRVWNDTGSTITDGVAVHFSESSNNGFPGIHLSRADTYETGYAIGVTTTSIANNSYGYVTQKGKVNGIDTHLFNVGDEIYLSETTYGGFRTTPPDLPAIAYSIGRVVQVGTTDGIIQVDPKAEVGRNFPDGSIVVTKDGLLTYEQNLYYDQVNDRLGINTQSPQANLHVAGDALFTGNVQIDGNLVIANAQSISTTELVVSGNVIVMNEGFSGSPTVDAEIVVNRGNESNARIVFDETYNEWTIDEGDGSLDHILDSGKTANTWAVYSAMDTYEKEYYPIGANLANSINELAQTANITAYQAIADVITETADRQANVGAAVISVTSAYQANVGAGLIDNKLASDANVGSGLIALETAITSAYEANVGSGLIATETSITSAYEANVGSGLISVESAITSAYEANVGSGLLALDSSITSAYQSNVGSGLIATTSAITNAYQSNVGSGLIATTSAITSAYQANVGAGLILNKLASDANSGAGLIALESSITSAYQANVGASVITLRQIDQSIFDQANLAYATANNAATGSLDPVARNTADRAFDQANAAYDAANSAVTTGEANVGAAVISITSAYEGNVGAGLIATTTAYQSNVGAGLIANKLASDANVGAGLISLGYSITDAYQANVGAGLIGTTNVITSAYQANTGAALITAKAYTDTETTNRQANVGAGLIATTSAITSAYQANTGAALITAKAYTDTETTNRQANVGAAVISLTSAYEANVGSGLIANKLASDANIGAGLIALDTSLTSAYQSNVGSGLIATTSAITSAYQANVGSGLIANKLESDANVGAGLISTASAITSAYEANVGAGLIASTSNVEANIALKVSKSGDTMTGALNITDSTSSTSTGSGALIISGGAGVGENLHVGGDTVITGNLTVNGVTSTINSITITVDDKNIELGSVATPTDITADGGGITLKGATDKTLNWVNATGAWTSSENVNLASGKEYYLNGTSLTSLYQANVGSGLIATSNAITSAYQANVGAGLISTASAITSAYQSNVGAGLITTTNAITSAYHANVGAGLISTTSAITSAYQANVGSGLISNKLASDANTGAAVISITSAYQANTGAALITAKAYTDTETSNREANVGAAVISITSAYQANVGAGLINNKAASDANTGAAVISITSAYQANVGAGIIDAKSFTQTVFDSANTKVISVAGISGNTVSNTNLIDAIKTVDGSSSGLDADLLDGYHATDFFANVGAGLNGLVTTFANDYQANVGAGLIANKLESDANVGAGLITLNTNLTSAYQANVGAGLISLGFSVTDAYQANVGAGLIGTTSAITSAYQANVGSGLIANKLASDANVGAGLITLNTNLTSAYQANAGVALITAKAYTDTETTNRQANVGAGLIATTSAITSAYQANVGAGLITLNTSLTSAYQANVGAGLIANKLASDANVGAGLISTTSTITSAYQANAGVALITAKAYTDTANTNLKNYVDTEIANINVTNLSIDDLTDVDTTTVAPSTGQYLKWDGTNWVPASVTGSGTITYAEQTVVSDTYTGDGTTVSFDTSIVPDSKDHVMVALNGVIQDPSTYSLSGLSIIFSTAPDSGDNIELRTFSGYSTSATITDYKSYRYTLANNTTTISGNDDNSNSLSYTAGKVEVYVNGVRLSDGIDYTATNGTTIVVGDTIPANSVVEVVSLATATMLSNSVQVESIALTANTADQPVASFSKIDYRSAKFFIQMSHDTEGYHVTEALVLHDGANTYITEYGTLYTGSNSLGTVSATISSNNVVLLVSPEYTNTTIKTKRIPIET